jgi:hypothetical protein
VAPARLLGVVELEQKGGLLGTNAEDRARPSSVTDKGAWDEERFNGPAQGSLDSGICDVHVGSDGNGLDQLRAGLFQLSQIDLLPSNRPSWRPDSPVAGW